MTNTNRSLLVVALVVLLGVGAVNRWVRVSRAGAAHALTPLALPLAEIPTEIGPYTARDIPLSSDVMRVAAVDSYVQREYLDGGTGRRIVLYVGYWGRENVGMGHGPEVCYPAAGWSVDAPPFDYALSFDDLAGPVKAVLAFHRFFRAQPEGVARCAVGFVAVTSGEYRPSSRGVFFHQPGSSRPEGGHYLAQVHISAYPDEGGWVAAEQDIVEFAAMILPHVARCLPRAADG
ncbi:MAG: exosortase-associated EpsI family protein [Planctomycetes bacterium]|nr:exosortase-associated EpsI family protein [Planctomycetota bacterium]